jgi:hypothetical protein
MKGTKEFYEVVEQFEKDFRNGDSDLYVSCQNPLARSPKESKSFYENGMVNQIFNAYLMGYSLRKSLES